MIRLWTYYAARLQVTYAAFKNRHPSEAAAVNAILEQIHDEGIEVLARQRAYSEYSEFVLAWDALNGREPVELIALGVPYVDGRGAIWDTKKFENLDAGWIESVIDWLTYWNNRHGWVATPQRIPMDNTATFAIVGDWGTGFYRNQCGAERVCAQITSDHPDYSVHLGDVYYAGTGPEETDFASRWPHGAKASFAVNSNHEMYSGGYPYFGTLGNDPFTAQRNTSYFALENDHWIVVGLDSAYHASVRTMYHTGAIDKTQEAFLHSLRKKRKPVIVLSHHEGSDLTGTKRTALWKQVQGALGDSLRYWYWGHSHNAVRYPAFEGCLARCTGHGGIPYGVASVLKGQADLWSEEGSAGDPAIPERVLNGYVRLKLDGANITEQFIGEDGSVRP